MTARAEQQADRWPAAMRLDTAAAYLDLSRMTFLRWVEEERVSEGKKIGGMRFWDRRELDRVRDRIFDAVEATEDSADERKRRWQENKDRQKAAGRRNDPRVQLRP